MLPLITSTTCCEQYRPVAGILIYLFIAYVMWIEVYKWTYRQKRKDYPNLEWTNGDRMFGVLWGGFISLFWPIFLPVAILCLLARWVIKSVPGFFERLENNA